MTNFRAGHFQYGLLLVVALSASIGPAAGQGYTPEQEQACTPDAFRLCGAAIPDIGRVTACMAAKKSQLSPACRAHFRSDNEREAVGQARQPLIEPEARMPASATGGRLKKPAKPATT